MRDLNDLFDALAESAFRRAFSLGVKEREYLRTKGIPVIVEHAHDFIGRRLAPADPPNDGKQTPFRGHPVFVAQHATATCCRGCLERWHRIPTGRELTVTERDHVVTAIRRWLETQ